MDERQRPGVTRRGLLKGAGLAAAAERRVEAARGPGGGGGRRGPRASRARARSP